MTRQEALLEVQGITKNYIRGWELTQQITGITYARLVYLYEVDEIMGEYYADVVANLSRESLGLTPIELIAIGTQSHGDPCWAVHLLRQAERQKADYY